MAPDASLEALWKNVLDRWEHDAAHHAFPSTVSARGSCAEAAARYRGIPGIGARAERGETAPRCGHAGLLALEASRPPPASRAERGALVLVVLFMAGAVALTGYASPALKRAGGSLVLTRAPARWQVRTVFHIKSRVLACLSGVCRRSEPARRYFRERGEHAHRERNRRRRHRLIRLTGL